MDKMDKFNQKLIGWETGNPFPYVDPPRGWKPPFIVDAENYLQWFERIYKSTIGQGYIISFIVGDPGAGKSHFACYLDYLFNAKKKFKGIYSTFSAGQNKITARELWMDFFLNNDVIKRIKELIDVETIEHYNFRSENIRRNITNYINGTLEIDNLNDIEIQDMAAGVSSVLATKGAGLCMVLDNIDEYLRYLNSLHQPLSDLPREEREFKRQQQELEDLQNFFGTLRTACRDMPNFLLLIACTTQAYKPIERHSITVDRTFAGRVQYQSEILRTLSQSQTYELVHKYLQWWSLQNGVDLPLIEGCMVKSPNGDTISIYPFTKTALQEIFEVTGQFARDIKMICNACINQMKNEQKVWIVKDEYLAYAIEEAHKRRPQIIPSMNLEKFRRRRTIWMKETMGIKLRKAESLAKSRYSFGIDQESLIEKLSIYVINLGITVEKLPSIQNKENLRWIDPKSLRIWGYGEGKRVLVSHVFSNDAPLKKTYFKYIEWRDISNAISYVDAGIATHILFATRWCGGFSKATLQYYHKTSWYEPIIETINMDDSFFKVIGAVETENEKERKYLIEHVDEYHFKLRETLDRLVAREKPKYKPPSPDKPIRYY